jgi:very-short-patch-repair endonuclease
MPRFVRYNSDRYPISEQVARSKSYRVFGYKRWIDPFPAVLGTRPEKMVYEQLVRRGIRFSFLNDFTYSIPEIDFLKEYQTDFRLPDQKIIIEVQGAYWHSKPEAIESDAFKLAVYQSAGWQVLAWWDYEIEDDVNKLFRNEPLLSGYGYIGKNSSTELPVESRKKQDTSKGIRTLNTKRAYRVSYRKKAVAVKKRKTKGLYTYATGIK